MLKITFSKNEGLATNSQKLLRAPDKCIHEAFDLKDCFYWSWGQGNIGMRSILG